MMMGAAKSKNLPKGEKVGFFFFLIIFFEVVTHLFL